MRKDLSGDNSLNVITKLIMHNYLSLSVLKVTNIVLHYETTLKPGVVVYG